MQCTTAAAAAVKKSVYEMAVFRESAVEKSVVLS